MDFSSKAEEVVELVNEIIESGSLIVSKKCVLRVIIGASSNAWGLSEEGKVTECNEQIGGSLLDELKDLPYPNLFGTRQMEGNAIRSEIQKIKIAPGVVGTGAGTRNVVPHTKLVLPTTVETWKILDEFVKKAKEHYHPIIVRSSISVAT